jgi:hypothetical protein
MIRGSAESDPPFKLHCLREDCAEIACVARQTRATTKTGKKLQDRLNRRIALESGEGFASEL